MTNSQRRVLSPHATQFRVTTEIIAEQFHTGARGRRFIICFKLFRWEIILFPLPAALRQEAITIMVDFNIP